MTGDAAENSEEKNVYDSDLDCRDELRRVIKRTFSPLTIFKITGNFFRVELSQKCPMRGVIVSFKFSNQSIVEKIQRDLTLRGTASVALLSQ